MMTDDQPRTDEARAAHEQAKQLKKDALRQLGRAIRIRKGTEEVKRTNGIAAALSQRWETQ